jgi:hypothetical protein
VARFEAELLYSDHAHIQTPLPFIKKFDERGDFPVCHLPLF